MKGEVYLDRDNLAYFIDNIATFAFDNETNLFIETKNVNLSELKQEITDNVSSSFSLVFEKMGDKITFTITNFCNDEKIIVEAWNDNASYCSSCHSTYHPNLLFGIDKDLCEECFKEENNDQEI